MLLLTGVTVVVPPVECHTTWHVTKSTECESECSGVDAVNVWYVTNEQIVFQLLCRCTVTRTWNTPLISSMSGICFTDFHLKQTQGVSYISKCPAYMRSQYFYITTCNVVCSASDKCCAEYRLDLDITA